MCDDKNPKLEALKAFHDEAERRIDFLLLLDQEGHRSEALTLCVSYIDSFAQWLCWPSSESGNNFVRTIMSFGGNPQMGLIYPLQAITSFEKMKSVWQQITLTIKKAFPGPEYELFLMNDFLNNLKTSLTTDELQMLQSEVWRGSIAATAYYSLRNPSIHSFGSSELIIPRASYKGEAISIIGFLELYDIVKNNHKELRYRSENNIQWFGDDKIVGIGA